MSHYEQLFERWLSGELSPEEQQKVEHELSSDPMWGQRVLAARQVDYYAAMDSDKAVPEWDRASTFEFESKGWWQWQGLPVLSTAFSCMALALVIFNVEFRVSEQGLLVSFGNNQAVQHQQLTELVDKKLEAYTQQQQVNLANYSMNQLSKQQESNLQLASYILETSRKERKEDMSDFIQYLNELRQDDQLEQRIKFRELEDAIQYQTMNLSNSEAVLRPVSWTVEE